MAYGFTFTNKKISYPQFDPSQVNSDGEFLTMIPNEDGVPFLNENLTFVEEDVPHTYDVKILNENQVVVKQFEFDNTDYGFDDAELLKTFNSMAESEQHYREEKRELDRQEVLRQQLLQELNPDDLDDFVLTCDNGWTNPWDESPVQIYLNKKSDLITLQEAKEKISIPLEEVIAMNTQLEGPTCFEEEDPYYPANHWEIHGLTRPPEIVEGQPLYDE